MSDGTKDKGISEYTAGCGFLSAKDLQEAIEGRLSPPRRTEFEAHVDKGCSECITLAADLETFRRILASGTLESERREAEKLAEPLRALLRREIRRRNLISS